MSRKPRLTRSGAIRKADALRRWQALPAHRAMKPRPIPYKHKGSTIDEDGIRITGTLDFIEAVQSHLKALLAFEGIGTRLGVAFSEITDRETGARITDRYRCSIQVHQRGGEAALYHYAHAPNNAD